MGSSSSDFYLYMQKTDMLCRLNISRICRNERSDIEIVYASSDVKYPLAMGCLNINSKIYFVGGDHPRLMKGRNLILQLDSGSDSDIDNIDNIDNEDDWWDRAFNYDVFELNTSRASSGPMHTLLNKRDEVIPRMRGPKPMPIVAIIQGKFYVLPTDPEIAGRFSSRHPFFEVYDHGTRAWTSLPNPSFYINKRLCVDRYIYTHMVAENNLLYIFTYHYGVQVFNVTKNKWLDEKEIPHHKILRHVLAAVEFRGFIIAIPKNLVRLMALPPLPCDSSSGNADVDLSYEELLDLRTLVDGYFVHACQTFVHLFDDDHLCLLMGGSGEEMLCCALVVIFRLSISTSDDDPHHQRLSLHLVRNMHVSNFDPYIYIDDLIRSSFIMHDHLNMNDEDIDAEASVEDTNRLDGCEEDWEKRAAEYIGGILAVKRRKLEIVKP